MTGKGVALAGMFERVPDNLDLAVIKQVRGADFRFHFLVFGRLFIRSESSSAGGGEW